MQSSTVVDVDKHNVCQQAKERAEFIWNEGIKYIGVSTEIDPNVPPSWFDPQLFSRAQELWTDYKVIIRVSQLLGLNLVLYHESGTVPLLITGNSSTIPKLFYRYISTALHVKNWFEADPFAEGSACHRSLRLVRGMHDQVMHKMNAEHKLVKLADDHLWMSQFSMCHAQFSFVGMMAVFPKQLGFHNFTDKDFTAMFHFWRVIGYCLGVENRFNLCEGSNEEIFELCRYIYFNQWKGVIDRTPCRVGVEMSKGISVAMQQVFPFLNYNALMLYGSRFLDLEHETFEIEGARERLIYWLYFALFGFMSKSRACMWLLGKVSDRRLRNGARQRCQHFQALAERYPQFKLENDRCPYNIKFNYLNEMERNDREQAKKVVVVVANQDENGNVCPENI